MLSSSAEAADGLFGVARMSVRVSLAARRSARNLGPAGAAGGQQRGPAKLGRRRRARRLRRGADPSPSSQTLSSSRCCVSDFKMSLGKLRTAAAPARGDSAVGYVLAGALKGGVLLAVRATLNLSLADLFSSLSRGKWRALVCCCSCDLHAARFRLVFLLCEIRCMHRVTLQRIVTASARVVVGGMSNLTVLGAYC